MAVQSNASHMSRLKGAHGVCFVLKLSKELLLLFTYLITMCKDIIFPLITKSKSNKSLSYLSVNLIQNENAPLPINSLYKASSSQFVLSGSVFHRKLDKSLCTSLIIRIKSIPND